MTDEAPTGAQCLLERGSAQGGYTDPRWGRSTCEGRADIKGTSKATSGPRDWLPNEPKDNIEVTADEKMDMRWGWKRADRWVRPQDHAPGARVVDSQALLQCATEILGKHLT